MLQNPTLDPSCRKCRAILAPHTAFCAACGTPTTTVATGRIHPMIVAAVALATVAAILGIVLWRGQAIGRTAPPSPTPGLTGLAAAALPPDISRLTPRERFDRLYRRVMNAARTGDVATVQRFAPMALAAFAMLDSADIDAQYHAALIKLHTGDAAGARALGDRIVAQDSAHLLGYVVQGMAARWAKDSAALPAIYAAFHRHAQAELASGRPEYAEHQFMLDEFRRAAAVSGR